MNDKSNIRGGLAALILCVGLCGAFGGRGAFWQAINGGVRPSKAMQWLAAPYAASYYTSRYWFESDENKADLAALLLVTGLAAGLLAPAGLGIAKFIEGDQLRRSDPIQV